MAEKSRKKLGDLLVEEGVLPREQIDQALTEQEKTDEKLGTILTEEGLLEEEELVDFLGKQTGYPVVNLESYPIQDQALETLSENQASRYQVLPLMIEENKLTVAMADPLDIIVVDDLEQLTGYDVEPVISPRQQIVDFIDLCYSAEETTREKQPIKIKSSGPSQGEDIQKTLQRGEGQPVVRLVNKIIADALERGASNIHLNPREKCTRILYRIDGMSRHYTDLQGRLHDPVVSRLKLIAEKSSETAEAGKSYQIIRMEFGHEDVIFRLHTTPTRFGDKLTIKVCRGQNYEQDLIDLGLDMSALSVLESFLSAPRGLIIFTGPAGSGKTTSLYASLQYFADTSNTIISVENPVEFELDYCTQLEMPADSTEDKSELVYEALEADPDVIMVGEMGEPEVARAVLYAAATGKKVLSTYYADNAVDTLYHLANTDGVDRFELANSLNGVVAQRLVRLIKDEYKEEYEPPADDLQRLDLPESETYYRPNPPTDSTVGYQGRTGIFQLLPMTDELRFCVLNDEPYQAYQEAAQTLNISSLREKGSQKILAGSTTIEEVLRATFREDFAQSLSLADQ